jgi:DNA primase
MDRDSVKALIRELHEDPNVKMEDRGGWVSAPCPLAEFRHEKGTDNRFSFGVKVDENEQSTYNCFACHAHGYLLSLVDLVEEYTGRDLSELREQVDDADYLSPFVPNWDNRKRPVAKELNLEPADESLIEIYDSAVDHPYVRGRGISNNTIRWINLRVDPDNKGEERILFPVYDHKKRFFGFSGRSIHEDTRLRVRDYFGLPKQYMLLGSHLVDPAQDDFIVLVEGLFDYAKVWEYGYPAVAVMHSTVTLQQAHALKEIGLPVVSMFDNDAAGRSGESILVEMVGRHLPLYKVRYPGGRRPPKDPGELTREQVESMIDERRIL